MAQRASAGKSFLRKLLQSFLVGVAFMVPGISGGAMAATLGIYEPAIAALSSIRRRPARSIRYLLPIAIGGALGAFFAGVVLVRLLGFAETQTVSLIMGVLIGTLPKLWRDAHREFPTAKYWLLMLAGVAVTGVLFFAKRYIPSQGPVEQVNLFIALAGGGVMGAGAVVPGISGSFFLVLLGWYRPLIEAITSFNIPIAIATILGFAVVVLLLVKVTHQLFVRHRHGTMSVIVGFVVGSIGLMLPVDFFSNALWLNVQMVMAGFGVGLLLSMMKE